MNNEEPFPEYDPNTRVSDDLKVTQPGERTICEIKRHPIGIIGIYTISGLVLVVVSIIVFGIIPALTSNSAISAIGVVILLLLIIICSAYNLVFTKVYWGNTWILTSDSVTQITQTSLFKRSSSQLSLHSLEDVTAEQNGILANFANYGQIRMETAGEREKYVFNYCPNPNYYAREILAAREALEKDSESTQVQSQAPNLPYQPPTTDA